MNAIDFCFWLQGHFEISETNSISEKQAEIIRNHLDLVFKHEIDPLRETETNASKTELNSAHNHASVINGNDKLIRC